MNTPGNKPVVPRVVHAPQPQVIQPYRQMPRPASPVIVIQQAPRTLLGSIARGIAWLALIAVAATIYFTFFPTQQMRIERTVRSEVSAHLRSPGTASYTFHNVKPLTDGTWAVSGDVDSQNAFGGVVRSHFSCIARPKGEGFIIEELEAKDR